MIHGVFKFFSPNLGVRYPFKFEKLAKVVVPNFLDGCSNPFKIPTIGSSDFYDVAYKFPTVFDGDISHFGVV